MFNLIKMDLHRLFRSVSLIVMVAVCFGIAAINTAVTKYFPVTYESAEAILSMEVEMENSGTLEAEFEGAVYDATLETMEDIENNAPGIIDEFLETKTDFASLFESILTGGFLTLLTAIFVTIFVCAEQKNGFIKNIAGQHSFRGSLVISKTVTAAVQVAVLFAASAVFTIITQAIAFGDEFALGLNAKFFGVVALQYLVHLAFAVVVIFVCILTRSSAFSMTIGVLLSSGFFSFIYAFVNSIVQKLDGFKDFNIMNYMIDQCALTVTGSAGTEAFVRTTIVAAAYIVVAGAGAMVLMQKRDVK